MLKIVHHQPEYYYHHESLVGFNKKSEQQNKRARPGPSLPALCQSLLRIDVVFAPVGRKEKNNNSTGSFRGFMAIVENDTRFCNLEMILILDP